MTSLIKFSSRAKLKPGFGYLVSCGKQKYEFLNLSEINDEEISKLSRDIRFSSRVLEITMSTPAACSKAIENINTASARASDPKQRSELLELPRELRNMILSLVLVRPGLIPSCKHRLFGTKMDVSILYVSRLISQEAFSILFGQNHFKASYADLGRRFRQEDAIRELLDPGFFSQGFLSYARELTIDWPKPPDISRIEGFLEKLQSLTTLRIRVRIFVHRPLLGQTFTHHLLKLRGLKDLQIQTHDLKTYAENTIEEWSKLEEVLKKVVTFPKNK